MTAPKNTDLVDSKTIDKNLSEIAKKCSLNTNNIFSVNVKLDGKELPIQKGCNVCLRYDSEESDAIYIKRPEDRCFSMLIRSLIKTIIFDEKAGEYTIDVDAANYKIKFL